MKKINKKGFTLIELLAVIVVLAIVLVVTIPSVLTSMKSAREKQLENAYVSIKQWFEKQYESAKLGEEYASDEFKSYLNEVCATGTEDDKAECKKLTKYTPLTENVVKAAGLDSEDIDYNNSYVAFSNEISNSKADIILKTTEESKISNGVTTLSNSNFNTNINENLFDLSKRNAVEYNISSPTLVNTVSEMESTIGKTGCFSSSNYIYPAAYGGTIFYKGRITNVETESDGIKFKLCQANYGVSVPFILETGATYKLSFATNKTTDIYVTYVIYDKDKVKQSHTKINNNGTFVANTTPAGKAFPDGMTSIIFTGTVNSTSDTDLYEFTNIKLVKVSN